MVKDSSTDLGVIFRLLQHALGFCNKGNYDIRFLKRLQIKRCEIIQINVIKLLLNQENNNLSMTFTFILIIFMFLQVFSHKFYIYIHKKFHYGSLLSFNSQLSDQHYCPLLYYNLTLRHCLWSHLDF